MLRATHNATRKEPTVPLDPTAVGWESPPRETSWQSEDCLLYALGVGAGPADLAYITENSIGVEQRALPTIAVVLGQFDDEVWQSMGTFSWAMMVHGGQEVVLHRPIPAEGRIVTTHRLARMWDKGKAAVVEVESNAVDAGSGAAVFTLRTSLFIRGEGGWGGDRGPSAENPIPDRAPDHEIGERTHANQALIYRLCGDRNPLHSDPTFARKAGFDQPILHGLCTFGVTGRALLKGLCDDDPDRFGGMSGRFASPVLPGDELVVRAWNLDDGAAFQTVRADGTVVFDAGRFTFS
jgi:acyl dehydratase